VGEQIVPLTISVGVASEIPDHKKNAEALLNRADSALYQAKALGRNRVSAFETVPVPDGSVRDDQAS
jgi:diguanylate cyclase (GGDEF)-like protein